MRELELFRAPKLKLRPRRIAEIPFSGNVAAGAILNLVTGTITYKFRITKVKMIFTDEADNLVEHRWFIDRTPSIVATGTPAGRNIFERESPTAAFFGRAIIRVVNCNIESEEGEHYIKLYTNNGTAYAYNLNASVTIEEVA